MSGVGQSEDGVEASTSGMMETTMMEGEEYYNPDDTGTWAQKEMSDQLCRICAKPNQYLIPIFEGEGIEHQLEPKIQKHLPIEVSESDDLPLQVCYQCASTLIAWNDLVIACIEADKKLRQMQEQEEEDEDDKGAEFYDEPIHDSDEGEDPVEPSTSIDTVASGVQSDATSHPKRSPGKAKKPKLKMTLVKSPTAGPSGVKSPLKRVASKTKEDTGQEVTERCLQQKAYEPLRRLLPKPMVSANPPINSTQIVMIKVENLNPVCAYCGLSFNCNRELVSHIAGAHSDDVFHCDVCDSVRFEAKEQFDAHMKMHPSGTHCEDDENIFNRLPVLVELNEPSDSTCDEEDRSVLPSGQIDGNKITSQFDLNVYMKTHKKNVDNKKAKKMVFRHPCSMCGRTFTRLHDLKRHLEKIHQIEDDVNISNQAKMGHKDICDKNTIQKKEKFTCDICSHEFTRSFDLKRHRKTKHVLAMNTNNNLYASSIEDTKQMLKMQESADIQLQSNQQTQPNNIFILPTSSRLENYVTVESSFLGKLVQKEEILRGQQEYSCFVCKKIFTNKSEMDSHDEAHSPEEVAQASAEVTRLSEEEKVIEQAEEVFNGRIVYRCTHCNRLIMQRRGFIEHLRIHSGLKPFTCHVCGKQFRIWNLLNRHIQDVHEGLKRYPCDICGRKFANSSARNDHHRIHTGERPFICHICGKAFKSKSCLFIHNRFHSNNFPHKCTFCEKRYRTRQQLKEHVTLHTGEKPNTCNLCGKAFRLNSVLRRHKHNHDRKEKVDCEICGKSFPQLRYLKLHVRSHNVRPLISVDTRDREQRREIESSL